MDLIGFYKHPHNCRSVTSVQPLKPIAAQKVSKRKASPSVVSSDDDDSDYVPHEDEQRTEVSKSQPKKKTR